MYVCMYVYVCKKDSSVSGLWQGYLPANKERRELVLKRKREEYFGFIEQYYHSRTDEHYKDTYRQVLAY